MSSAETINDILDELDQIIAECEATNHRLGVFAYVYRRTTAEIAKEIALGHFEDNKRMEAFDVAFAMLYINAYKNYKVNKPVSKSWAFAFEQAEKPIDHNSAYFNGNECAHQSRSGHSDSSNH
ncbi:hypothetical protein FCN74_05230 [Mesohalobacter halotolerans]|uniref:Uncharacterized protein n=1 Tax=Mesohalobacter halotolerans TaxID=1883405 RepID=A0A4U5TT39_9FLAO|nr:DUF5995 family protein [Mesohalobacter halotolerans]TKS56448.1 hypothetical protein FCN74_05230 [Mesohalobacter halotolerans]